MKIYSLEVVFTLQRVYPTLGVAVFGRASLGTTALGVAAFGVENLLTYLFLLTNLVQSFDHVPCFITSNENFRICIKIRFTITRNSRGNVLSILHV